MSDQEVSAVTRARLCNLDQPSRPAPCASLHRACFHAEQIVLYGPDAVAEAAAASQVLARAPNLYDVKRPGQYTGVHRMLQLAAPGRPYTYVPLAVCASKAMRSLRPSSNRSVFEVHAVQPEAPASFSDTTALAFVTTWANAWQETFHRAVSQVFEEWCRVGGAQGNAEEGRAEPGMVVVPAAYGGTSPRASDDKELWLRPFSEATVWLSLTLTLSLILTLTLTLTLALALTLTLASPYPNLNQVWPMSLTPQPEPLQQAVFGNRQCNGTCFRHYRALSATYFASRPRQCFERVRLCDFSRLGLGLT